MKIGIMGGTFDPIHNGHLMLGHYAKEMFSLDEIWFMPNANPPHKTSSSIESFSEHRVQMVKLAIAEEKNFLLQPYEVNRTEVNYSYLTMESFKTAYPDNTFYFIIGADSLFAIERWAKPERLLKTCIVLAAYRDGKNVFEMETQIQYLNQKYDADIRLLNTPDVDISSSAIRRRIKEGLPINQMVPQVVCDYIYKNHLFEDNAHVSD